MLACRSCGRTYEADEAWRCDCGDPLDLADPPRPAGKVPPETLDRDRGLAAWEDLLPAPPRPNLGAGWTPLVPGPDPGTSYKLEHLAPTGSFKDRGAAVTVGLARRLGVDRVLEDSSGNAGLAVATYARAAGLEARIYVPSSADPGKTKAIKATGAELVPVDGSRSDVADACVHGVDDGEGWYASHAWNPAFLAGTSTLAFEVAAQRGWSAPDALVTPVGHGTLLLGAYRGFRTLREAGWIDDVPRLLGVQARGCAPVVEAVDGPRSGDRNTVADGIQIREPVRGDQIVEALGKTGGTAVAVGAEATRRHYGRLRRTGFHVEPTSAAAAAGLELLREEGVVGERDEVVVALTGSGLKG